MPSSAGSARPPDPSEIVSRAKGGSRVGPGGRAASSAGDPTAVFSRYGAAADPSWEQFRDSGGIGTSPTDVMGMIDLAGGDETAARFAEEIGPYQVIPIYDGKSVDYGFETTADFFYEGADKYLEDEGFYSGVGYRYANLGDAPGASVVSSIGTAPADITQSPTSTTNPDRPRTVAAGYDSGRKVLTTVFRDGTFYNYYGVSGLEWNNFKRARSKGRFIRMYLDAKTRGTADVGMVPQAHQELLYKVARTMQVFQGGYTGKQKIGSKRGTGGRYAYGRSGSSTSGGRVYRRGR